jgi:hypothetical protein
VGDYFLYELADLRSDHRKLLLISQHGSMVRETRFDVPMGFVSDEPDHSHLLAVRTLGQQELVAYQWHWGERPSGNQQHVERIIP